MTRLQAKRSREIYPRAGARTEYGRLESAQCNRVSVKRITPVAP